MERTFVAIKPDAVERGLIGEIITRFEKKGFKIIAMKLIHLSREQAEEHYIEHKGKGFFDNVVNFLASGPIVAMAIQGVNAISEVRKMLGATRPEEATPGTMRADFAQSKESNIVHGSDSLESAKREIELYFSNDEIFINWSVPSEKWLEDK